MGDDPTPDAIILRRTLRNVAGNCAGKVVTIGVGLLLTPFLIRHLGRQQYGWWVLLGAGVAYSSLLDLRIPGAMIRYVAALRARNDIDQARGVIATGAWVCLVLGVFDLVLGFALASTIPRLGSVGPDRQGMVASFLIVGGAGIGAAIICKITPAILQGKQRFDLMNILGVVSALSFALTAVIVIRLGGGVIGVALASICMPLMMQPLSIWCINHFDSELRFGLGGAKPKYLRLMLPYSLSLIGSEAAGQLKTETDEIVIGIFASVTAIAPYAIARRLSSLPQVLTEPFLTVLAPLASELYARDDRRRLQALYIMSTRVTLAIFLPFAFVLTVFAKPILSLWIGMEYEKYTSLVLILTLSSLIDTSVWPAGGILQVMGRYRMLFAASACGAGVNLALSLILVRRYGLTGVALGTLIPTVVECLGFVTPYAMREMGVSIGMAARSMYGPVLFPAFPTLAALYIARWVIHPTTIIPLAAVAVCGLLLYGTVYVGIGASAAERGIYRDGVFSTLRFVKAATHV